MPPSPSLDTTAYGPIFCPIMARSTILSAAMPLNRWVAWGVAAALAAPLAILLHELAHFLAGLVFGFPQLMLHYGSVSDAAAESGFPEWQRGIQAAAGPLATLLIVLGCGVAVRRVGPSPWAVAPAFAAGVRSLAIGVGYLIARILRRPSEGANFDELNAARHLGVAVEPVIATNVVILLAAWVFLIRRVPRGQRIATITAIAVGTIGGLALYIGWLGPWLLP
jgi:hypothetical protein